MHFTRNVKPYVQPIRDALARGEDPLEVVPVGEGKGKGQIL